MILFFSLVLSFLLLHAAPGLLSVNTGCAGMTNPQVQEPTHASSTTMETPLSKGLPLPRSNTSSTLAIFVLSRRDAFTVRQAIRDTWANGHDNVFFVIGQPCSIPKRYRGLDEGGNSWCQVKPEVLDNAAYFSATLEHLAQEENVSHKIRWEQQRNHDLLLMQPPLIDSEDLFSSFTSIENNNMIDMYRTLPQKIKTAYQFVAQHLPNVLWTLKVDDDFYVRIRKFEQRLTKEIPMQQDPKRIPIVISGSIVDSFKAKNSGKWKEVPQYKPNKLYPTFPRGSFGHVVSRPIAEYIARYSSALFNYQGEDVSLGIWLNSSHFPNPFFNSSTQFIQWGRHMARTGNCSHDQIEVIGHDITATMMRDCYQRDRIYQEKGLL